MALKWLETDTPLSITGTGRTGVAALSATRIAFINENDDGLKTYDLSGGTWTQTGNTLTITGAADPTIVGLSSTTIAYIDEGLDELRLYTFDGTDWTLIGSGLSITGTDHSLAKMTSTRVALADDTTDTLRTYEWSGSAWSLVGNTFALSSPNWISIAGMSSTRIAYYDRSSNDLRTYDFDGTDWTLTGNELNIFNFDITSMAAVSSTRAVLANGFSEILRTYDFDGTDWTITGLEADYPEPDAEVYLAPLSGNKIVFYGSQIQKLRTFTLSEVLLAGSRDLSTIAQVGSNSVAIGLSNSGALSRGSDTRVFVVSSFTGHIECWDSSGGTFSQTGNTFVISGASSPLGAGLTSTRLVVLDSSGTIESYDFDGTNFSQVGTGVSINGAGHPEIESINDSEFFFYEENTDTLEIYSVDVDGNISFEASINVTGFVSRDMRFTKLNSTDIIACDTQGTARLRVYRWNGSTIAQVGNTFVINEVDFAPNATGLVVLENEKTFIIADSTFDEFFVYEWDGTDFSYTGSHPSISSVGVRYSLTRLSGNSFAFIESTNTLLKTLEVTFNYPVITIAGGDVTLLQTGDKDLIAETGVFTISGQDATLTKKGPTVVFSSTGTDTFVVPPGVFELTAYLWGSGGGGGSGGAGLGGDGGGGGYSTATLAVTPGETLDLEVATGGAGGQVPSSGDPGRGGGGGGYSVLKRSSTILAQAAGGGGGGGSDQNNSSEVGGAGGAGGGDEGVDGDVADSGSPSGGGNQAVGGVGGSTDGITGSANAGGEGGSDNESGGGGSGGSLGGADGGFGDTGSEAGGGGGGGGKFGGGGGGSDISGGAGGGGGGSGLGDTLIAGSGKTAGNTSHGDYIAGKGTGGEGGVALTVGGSGGNGLIVITYFADAVMVASTGVFVIDGPDVTLTETLPMVAGTGEFTVAGPAITLVHDHVLIAETGGFTVAGTNTFLRFNKRISVETGVFTIAGPDVNLIHDTPMIAGTGEFIVTGVDVGLLTSNVIIAETGVFVIAGTNTPLTETNIMAAGIGAFNIAGTGTGLHHNKFIAAETGEFVVAGPDVNFRLGFNMVAGTGAFVIAGVSSALLESHIMYAAPGAFTVAGPEVELFLTKQFSRETQKFSPSNLVVLFELDTTALGGTILRFTSSAFVGDAIVWDGNLFSPVPVEADGFEVSSAGALPSPTLRILNTPSLQSSVIALDNLIGATLTRIRTFKTFLDDGETPDPTAHFPHDVYKVDRKASQNKVFIEWELAASIDQEGRKIPGRQIIRDFCSHTYRVFDPDTETFDNSNATCPYVGAATFDVGDVPVSSPSDVCGKRLSSCKVRFVNDTLPTRAFPGVARVR